MPAGSYIRGTISKYENTTLKVARNAFNIGVACERAHHRVTGASDEEQSDPAGRSLVKRCQESWPALISSFFISASPERSKIPLIEKQQRRENCQSIMFDEERLDLHRVSNLLHVLMIKY